MKIAYWICTGIIAWIMGAGSVYTLTSPPPAVEIFRHLGYPDYFRVMLSVAKILGTAAILYPRAGILREWAYAGFTFDLIAASVSYMAVGDPLFETVFPLILLVPLAVSYRLDNKLKAQASHQLGQSGPDQILH